MSLIIEVGLKSVLRHLDVVVLNISHSSLIITTDLLIPLIEVNAEREIASFC